jgi:hypothetical protein
MKTAVIVKRVQLVVDFDFTPADDSVGWGAEAEINTVHVANFEQCDENNIEPLISAVDRMVIESACIKHGETEMRLGVEP